MRTLRKRTILFIIYSTTLLSLLGAGCSYVSDMVEGKITERSSFSIDVNYDSSEKQLTVGWDETDLSSNFAGYEIFITENVNDEYSGYDLVASKWFNNADLELYTTNSYVYDVSGIISQDYPKGYGTYFCRVGIIHWDHNVETRNEDTGYDVDNDGVWFDNELNYNNRTDIDQISGAALIELSD